VPVRRGLEIKCTLEEVELDKHPNYDCLSYTWEDPLYQKYLLAPRIYKDTTCPIDCNGEIFTITENLRDALVEIGKSRGGKEIFKDRIRSGLTRCASIKKTKKKRLSRLR
jgi:hypothetical protein